MEPLKNMIQVAMMSRKASDELTEADTPAPGNIFRGQIKAYLKCIGSNLAAITDTPPDLDRPKVGRRTFYDLLGLVSAEPDDQTWAETVWRMREIYNDAVEKLSEGPNPAAAIDRLHRKIKKQRLAFVTWPADGAGGERLEIDRAQLEALRSSARDRAARQAGAAAGHQVPRVRISTNLEIISELHELSAEQAKDIIRFIYALVPERDRSKLLPEPDLVLSVYQAYEGCTTIRLEVPIATAELLEDAFQRARLEGLVPDTLLLVLEPSTRRPRTILDPPRPAAGATWAETDARFRTLWRGVRLRQALMTPWRRLRWLLSPGVAASPLADVIRSSDGRAYASAGLLPANVRGVAADAVMAWLAWPLLTAVLLLATLWPLKTIMPNISIAGGVVSGLVLAIAGGQICSFVVAPIAAGAGGIFIGWAFGFAQAIAIGRIGGGDADIHAMIDRDVFTAVTGGPLGLAAPHWPGEIPPALIIFILLAAATAIAASGWLMAQPMRAIGVSPPRWPERFRRLAARLPFVRRILRFGPKGTEAVGAIIGSLVGGAIGVVRGLGSLFSLLPLAPAAPFALAYGLVGSAVFGLTIWISGRRGLAGAAGFAGAYGLAAVGLCWAIVVTRGLASLIILSGLSAIYQATFFTGAFVVASRFSRRCAVIATALEGGVGFTAFITYRLLTG